MKRTTDKLIINTHTTNFFNYFTSLLNNCESFIFNVAFINYSGIQLLLDSFKKLEENNVKGKILTSTYLNFTDPKALEKILEFKNIELKVYDSEFENKGFHPKGYIFELDNRYEVLIGSSNITASAFKFNIEWNLNRVYDKKDNFIEDILNEFSILWDDSSYIDKNFINTYKIYKNDILNAKSFKYPKKEISPNSMQLDALKNLSRFRSQNQKKALIVAATGTGKTFLAALDVKNFKPKRMLFLVHRENILKKAKESFEIICKGYSFGFFSGNKKDYTVDYLFATVQSLSKYYEFFNPFHFDYIVVDEAHHITSSSYKKLTRYFKPQFLLGLTATPIRSDGNNVYKFFDDNIASNITLDSALRNNFVSSFHYFGISDIKQLDYDNVNLNNIDEVAKFLMLNKRVDFIIDKMNFYGYSGRKRRVLAFCISKEHASYMSTEFNKHSIGSVSLTGEDSAETREKYIKMLQDEDSLLEVIFTVDIFNEGIDIPSVNMILMLRPTSSSIVFAQQLGRGLRKEKEKEFLTVLDFIGNHNKSFLIVMALLGDKIIDKDSIKLALNNGFANISNVHINMDEISKQRILNQIEICNFNSFKYLKEQYMQFKTILGKTPSMIDYLLYEDILTPLNFIDESKSYIEFLQRVEKNSSIDKICSDEIFLKGIRFIEHLMPLRRVYELAALNYLLNNDYLNVNTAKTYFDKYTENTPIQTVVHTFRYLNQEFFDSAQKSRYLKLVNFENDKIVKSYEFLNILKEKEKRIFIENSIQYGILRYEKEFGFENYGLPFLKLYEKYNMLNIALVCNFDKIHTSFRGSGFLKYGNDYFLFMTIQKDKLKKGFEYVNQFLSKDRFTFVSKPSHSRIKGDGEKLCNNKKFGIRLHIFARKFATVDNKTQKFIYLGVADTVNCKGDKPIALELKLEKILSNRLYEEFTKIV